MELSFKAKKNLHFNHALLKFESAFQSIDIADMKWLFSADVMAHCSLLAASFSFMCCDFI